MQDIEDEVKKLIAEILEKNPDEITPDLRLVEDLGMDSMMALEILAAVEKKYKIAIPEAKLPQMNSLAAVTAIAKEYIGDKGTNA